jgi:hypothetical protein
MFLSASETVLALNDSLVVCARQSCLIDAGKYVACVIFFELSSSMARGLDPIWKHTTKTA